MTDIAPVLIVTQGPGGNLVTILCPRCHRRHRHHWPDPDQPPGTRMSHCKHGRRMPYLIGEIPTPYLLEAAAGLQRAANYLHRTAWFERFQTGDVMQVAEASRVLAAAVHSAIGRMR